MVDFRTIIEAPAEEMLEDGSVPADLDEEIVKRVRDRRAGKEDYREYMRQTHGDPEDAIVKFFFLADEEGFDVEAEDVEVITDSPPTSTFQ